ncbi:glucose dehydrogenase [FAD, quinone] [Bemisia tabaci]|uniref:glucose dehydrogenase [FAD, quinone] n=1 Tax=Bemisia tabaci TaxID=7038 RepID=UPI003B281714
MLTIHLIVPVAIVIVSCARTSNAQAYTIFQSVLRYYREGLNIPANAVKETSRIEKEYDFIVVGAGSGGSVVANRLTENPAWTVLLLEAGKEEIFLTDIPLLVSYIIDTDYNWGYRTQPSKTFCLGMQGNRCNWPRGKAMGGTSVINYMVYTRGCKADYDNWAALGNTGWSYDDVLPYFKKSEDVGDPELIGSPYHGTGGYLRVSKPAWNTHLSKTFLKAGQELGYNIVDYNEPVPIGFSTAFATTKDGARLSASKAFLRPIRNRKNFHVVKQARVTRVLINEQTRQTFGVEFLKNRRTFAVKARKEVIISAGTLNSPQILMLSGIGPRDHLQELGIPVLEDLKVGHNLQDHVSMAGLAFLVNDSVTIVEDRFRSPRFMVDYLVRGKGPYTLPGGAEAVAFTLTKYANDSSQPDMELVFGPGALTGDTGGSLRNMFKFKRGVYERVFKPYEGHDAWGLVPILLQPHSRGYMKLRSKNPLHWPLFYPNYFSDERDLKTMVEGIKQAVAISRTRAFQRYDSKLIPEKFPGCERHEFESDDYWACAARVITTNLHHQVGTCKMGPEWDPDAVVDPRLRVRGVRGLRVVDASIMPVIPAGHTNAIVFMIGEKASDMIKEDWANANDNRKRRKGD